MNPKIITLDPVITPATEKTILSKDGFTCSLIRLGPGEETPRREGDQVREHILFVTEGQATVRFDDMNTILNQDQALLIPEGKQHVIAANREEEAKLLRVDVTPRQMVAPQIIAFDR